MGTQPQRAGLGGGDGIVRTFRKGAASIMEQLRGWQLAGDGGWLLFASTTFVGLSNFVFHVVVSRLLGPALYGALGSLLGFIMTLTVVVGALQVAVVQAVASVKTEPSAAVTSESIPLSLRRPMAAAVGLSAACVIILSAVSTLVEGFLHLSSSVPIVLFGFFVGMSIVSLVPQGVLLGRLNFKVVAAAGAAGAVIRIAAAIALVEAGFGLNGAVLASVLSTGVMLGILAWPLRHELLAAAGAHLDVNMSTVALSAAAVSGSAGLMGVAPILARHLLSSDAAGYFAAANQASQIALFAPGAVAIVSFPRFAAAAADKLKARRLLVQAMAAVGLLGGLTAAIMLVAPRLVINVLFGANYRPAAGALRFLAVAGGATAMINLLVYFHLARRSVVSTVLWPAVGLLVAFTMLLHGGMLTLAAIVATTTLAVLLVMTVAAMRSLGRDEATRRWPYGPRHRRLRAAAGAIGAGSQDSAGSISTDPTFHERYNPISTR